MTLGALSVRDSLQGYSILEVLGLRGRERRKAWSGAEGRGKWERLLNKPRTSVQKEQGALGRAQ